MIMMGTVMEIEKSKALVFTMDGNVVYVKPRLGLFVGQQIAFAKSELVTAKKRLLSALPFAAMAAALLIVACIATNMFGLSGFLPTASNQLCTAYIALDINPSVQFRIDADGKVLSVATLNDDGKTLMRALNIVGKPVDQAIDEAIAKARELGYIKDNKSVVLVAGTLNGGNGDVTGKRSEYGDKLQGLLDSMGGNGDADVLVLYVEDPSVQKNADKNGLSLGREVLREFAAQKNIELTDDEIRSGKISDLIDRVSGPQGDLPGMSEPADTAEPTETPKATPVDTAKPTATPAPTEEPTVKPTVEPSATPAPTAKPDLSVSAKEYGTGIKVTWSKAPDTGSKFLYYKVVFSVKDSTPRYPDNGYMKVVSDIATLSAVIRPGAGCSGGDFSSVKAGVAYYVSVTVVYEDGSVYGNAVHVKCPDAAEPTDPPSSGFDGTVSASVSGDHISISWDKAPKSEGFCYYKVVFSTSDSTPKYPDNGYLYAISDINDTSCTASPGQCYNGGDVGELVAGETYYISVTYVYDGEKLYGTVRHLTMPGEPGSTDDPRDGFAGSVSAGASGDHIAISWTKAPTQAGFCYYKVVLSKADSTPRYPDNGYLYAISDINDTSCAASPGQCYNGGDAGTLQAGQTYYISVTYVYGDRKLYGSVQRVTMPGAPEPTEFGGGGTSASVDGDTIRVSWTKLPADTVIYGGEEYADFQYYKVVYSQSANPKYPDDPYLAAISNRGTGSASFSVTDEGLESGMTYYFSVTYVFGDGKFIYAGDTAVTIP